MASPIVSVVVCTRDRCEKLRRCIGALLSIETDHAWELIVVHGSSDGTSEFLASLHQEHARPIIKILHREAPGLGGARNVGWRAASADIIAFTDDDCYVAPDYIDAIVSAFQSDVGFLGGRVDLYDPEDLPETITHHENYVGFEPYTSIEGGVILGANMIFRRTTLETIAGFDERFGAGTRLCADEDTDALARALGAGFAGALDPNIIVYHHHGRKTIGDLRKLMHNYDYGRGAYYAKLILNKGTRGTYLHQYARHIYFGFRYAGSWRIRLIMVGRSARELIGGARYIRMRLTDPTG
jgi:glycosyltransferase involved in cell wall biosynthesis